MCCGIERRSSLPHPTGERLVDDKRRQFLELQAKPPANAEQTAFLLRCDHDPRGQPGAMTLFQAPSHEHLSLAKHLTAERKTEEFVVGKGVVTRWERVRKSNHWLDALYNACAAGHLVGVRLLQQQAPPPRTWGKLSDLARAKRNGSSDAERWQVMTEQCWS